MATISSVLYANTNHPELKTNYPIWSDRCKQISKKWRALSNEKKAPFLQQARDNRSALRMKKAQQVSNYFVVHLRLRLLVNTIKAIPFCYMLHYIEKNHF